MFKIPNQECAAEFKELAVKRVKDGKLNPPGGKAELLLRQTGLLHIVAEALDLSSCTYPDENSRRATLKNLNHGKTCTHGT